MRLFLPCFLLQHSTHAELVQCRRASKGCLAPLPAQTRPRYSENPSNMANVFGPVNRHPAPPCQRGQCPTCQVPSYGSIPFFFYFFRICQNHATMLVNTRTSTFPLGAHSFHEARIPVVAARARLNRAASRSSSSTSVVRSVPKTAFNNPDRASVVPRASAVRCSPSTVRR